MKQVHPVTVVPQRISTDASTEKVEKGRREDCAGTQGLKVRGLEGVWEDKRSKGDRVRGGRRSSVPDHFPSLWGDRGRSIAAYDIGFRVCTVQRSTGLTVYRGVYMTTGKC